MPGAIKGAIKNSSIEDTMTSKE